MAVAVPTIGALFVQVDLQAALTTICGYIDATNVNVGTGAASISAHGTSITTLTTAAATEAAARAALRTYALAVHDLITALQSARVISMETGVWPQAYTMSKALITATAS